MSGVYSNLTFFFVRASIQFFKKAPVDGDFKGFIATEKPSALKDSARDWARNFVLPDKEKYIMEIFIVI